VQDNDEKNKNRGKKLLLLPQMPAFCKNMIILLHGKDSYRMKRELRKEIEKGKKAQKRDILLFEGESFSFDDFQREINQVSIFKRKKTIVLKNTLEEKDFFNRAKKLLGEMAASENTFIFFEQEPVESKIAGIFKKQGKVEKFDILKGKELQSWVQKELADNMDFQSLSELLARTGGDLWRTENEIEKLRAYKKNRPIEKEDVEEMVSRKAEADIFETIDALSMRNKKKALDLLHRHLEKGDPPSYLLAMINYQFRNIIAVKDLEGRGMPYFLMAKETGMKPYPLRKSFDLSKRFSLEDLKRIYGKIFQIDLKIKKGEIDPKTALDFLVAEI
jgi:DNA polymerase-3 subunit delta